MTRSSRQDRSGLLGLNRGMTMDYDVNELCSVLNATAETFAPADNPCFDELRFSDPTHVFTIRIFGSLDTCTVACNLLCSNGSKPKPRGVFEFTFRCDYIKSYAPDDKAVGETCIQFFRRLDEGSESKLTIARLQSQAIVIEAYG